jgi:IS30 family transposase
VGCVQLSVADREEISRGVAGGLSGREIAGRIGRHYSVVNREIGRHGGLHIVRHHQPHTARQLLHHARRESASLVHCNTGRTGVLGRANPIT